ncbi:DUF2225 domain-containing protein [Peribacillus frigoritolerans]
MKHRIQQGTSAAPRYPKPGSLYLAGEVSRRIGNEKAAIKYFSFVFERQKNAREASIIQMARDRFHELKRTQESIHPLLQH